MASDAGVATLLATSPDGGADRRTTGVAQSALHPRSRVSSAAEGCVDRWLKAHKLDRFGSEPGAMYTGGTPLFDERTGETRDRVEFVYAQHPDAKKACGGKPDGGAAE